jgi:hypothetical protein
MKKLSLLLIAAVSFLVAGCGLSTADSQATVAAQVESTLAAIPPQQVTVQVPATVIVPVTIEIPATVEVQVPVTVVVPATVPAATEPPASNVPTATSAPVVSNNAQDPLAGTAPTPTIDEKFDFPDKYYWYLFDSSTGEGKIEDEAFTLIVKDPEHVEWTFGGKKFSNFYVSTDTVVPNTTCKAGDHWGLIFRMKDNANFYMFGVSCDGKYRLMKRVDGAFEVVVDFTDSDFITDLGQKNALGVRAAGNQFSLYANGNFITTVSEGTFAEGVVGMYAASRLTPNLTVKYDNIAVYPVQ